MPAGSVDIAREGAVALVTFGNPPHNHLTTGLLARLADALAALDGAPGVRAVVLASAGKTFSAGADLAGGDGLLESGGDPLRAFYDQVLRLFGSGKPIVAAVQGAAVGAGLGLALAADLRVAAPEARFCANFVKLGFHPGFALSCTLPRAVGQPRAARMLLTGARYRPEEVLPWGLVDEVVEAARLRARALALAGEIAENAPLALLATRATLRRGLAEEVAAALAREHAEQVGLRATADFAEGVRAVAERRRGDFVGR